MTVLTSLPAVVAICLLPTVALAQQATSREMLRQHCTGDYLSHCGEFAPDGPEVEACFRRKARQLSPDCSAAIATYRQGQGRIRKVSAAR